jgi:hypothetical protein
MAIISINKNMEVFRNEKIKEHFNRAGNGFCKSINAGL